jgi:hypothetical protein
LLPSKRIDQGAEKFLHEAVRFDRRARQLVGYTTEMLADRNRCGGNPSAKLVLINLLVGNSL